VHGDCGGRQCCAGGYFESTVRVDELVLSAHLRLHAFVGGG